MPRYNRYVAVRVAPERLRQFRTGTVDLRTLLPNPPDDEWYVTDADIPYGKPLTLQPQKGPIPEQFLPLADYTLDDGPPEDSAA